MFNIVKRNKHTWPQRLNSYFRKNTVTLNNEKQPAKRIFLKKHFLVKDMNNIKIK